MATSSGKGQYDRPKYGTKDAEVLQINTKALKELRTKRKMTRVQLAGEVGVSVENIARIEKGQGGTYRITATKIAAALKTKIQQFVVAKV